VPPDGQSARPVADSTPAAVKNAGIGTIGLLGTAFTMEQDFYRDRLASHNLRVLVPGADDRAEVHRIIYDELCLGIIQESSRESYRATIHRLVEAEGVIVHLRWPDEGASSFGRPRCCNARRLPRIV
jgi:aspartate racemase